MIHARATARQAWKHGYALIIPEDAISGLDAAMHHFAVAHIFPRLARVVKSADISLVDSHKQ